MHRLAGRATLRALFAASALALAVGGAALIAGRAEAQTVAAPDAVFRDGRIAVEVLGQGPDVILIPGYGSSREVWRPLAERLSATHRVHLVQYAGFAGEPWTHGDGPLLSPAVEAVANYIETRGLERPAVIGHSMGGLSALLLAQARPDLVGRIMSVDSLPFFSALFGPTATAESARPFAAQAAAQMLSGDAATLRAGQEAGAPGLSKTPATQAAMVDWVMASDRQALATGIAEVMTTDARPGLSATTVPVWAVYAADADGGAPAAMADAMWSSQWAGVPDLTLERVDGARHFIMADQPEAFFAIVDRFLAE
ncbi:MAG: alpha/beta hydrolase [Alphaproteobacteria bacterium]|nr:alpha/beta hydrolase [Alphaproteobacteria bacterium]MBU1527021.1 alpha/beta hydrolase [Alphaproteobacteria bacterium]MBU2116702.1 alpha/beta hydrolase [Alphaproteobacteria bacterium]MBU2352412.1 alpha/beta hydrolase [Alphaproteobacteria bacterium]MBU2382172.1 alpha/beta hydrolase [Alphaproteobacteria bacterium]